MGGMFGGGAKNAYFAATAAQQGAQQQAAANREAAIAGTEMSMVNQNTPFGNLSYQQTGTSSNGNPLYTATQTFDPVTQRAVDAQKRVDYKTNELAESQADRANSMLGSNADFSDGAVAAKVQGMINPRLSRRFDQEETKLRDSLINRGLREGSQGFKDAMLSFNEGKTDAYSTEALNNRQQALQEIALPRNQVLNEISSLLGTQQIGQPQFVSTPQTRVQPGDFQGAAAQSIAAMNGMQQQKNAALGGIGSLAGTLGGAFIGKYSDERVKEDMTKIGKTDDGQNLYAYRYLGGGPLQIGLSAQEVEKKKPEAVREDASGIKMVDYALALARKGHKGMRHAA